MENDGTCDDVALRGDGVGEAEDGRGDAGSEEGLARGAGDEEQTSSLVDLTPDDDSGEARVGVLGEPVAMLDVKLGLERRVGEL